ncbi:MAG TPA: LysM peptidoglycan-binding domain-containing protein, partial [Acidimicrobiales bacterium]|nr:LysM peptidoglycan-binding domain-containing protein [Acidimicrobiales bacterium]
MRQIGIVAGLLVMTVAGQAHVAGASTYTLRWGDTLSRVARHFGVPVRALASTNGIPDADRVREGRVLRLPTRFGVAPLPSPVVVATGTGAHRVERGQTLSSIAGRYGLSVPGLARANGLSDANRLRAGQVLKIPGRPWLCPVQHRR